MGRCDRLKNILRVLENDARVSAEQISVATGIPETDVTRLISQAEKEQIILKYKTVINWDKVEDEHVFALIGVKLTPQKDVGYDATAGKICRYPQARTVYLISGTSDLVVLVQGKSALDIASFVSQKLATTEGVKETVTQFLLKRYKEDGEVIGGEERVIRQPVVF